MPLQQPTDTLGVRTKLGVPLKRDTSTLVSSTSHRRFAAMHMVASGIWCLYEVVSWCLYEVVRNLSSHPGAGPRAAQRLSSVLNHRNQAPGAVGGVLCRRSGRRRRLEGGGRSRNGLSRLGQLASLHQLPLGPAADAQVAADALERRAAHSQRHSRVADAEVKHSAQLLVGDG